MLGIFLSPLLPPPPKYREKGEIKNPWLAGEFMRKVVCKSGEKKGLYNDVFRYVCLYGYEFGACLSLVSQNTAFGLMCWMFCKSIQLFCMGGKTRIRDIFKLDKFLAMYNTYEKALHHLSHGGCGYVCMYVCMYQYIRMYVCTYV